MTHPTTLIHGTTDTARLCTAGPGGAKCQLCAERTQRVKVSNGVQHKREAAAAEQKERERRAALRRGS